MACHVYNNKLCKVFTIPCSIVQLENAQTQIICWENLYVIMLDNGVANINFKGFMVDNTHANQVYVRKIYGFHWFTNMGKRTQKHIRLSLQQQSKQLCKEYKDTKSMEATDIKYLVIMLNDCPQVQPQRRACTCNLLKWLGFWHCYYRQWGGHMLIVSF